MQQPKQRQQPRPSALPCPPPLWAQALERLLQPPQPIALVVDGVVDGQQLARLGKKHHHQAHGKMASGTVQVLAVGRLPLGAELVLAGLEQQLHGLAHVLAKLPRKLGFTAAGLVNRLQERPGRTVVSRRHRLAPKHPPQQRKHGRQRVAVEPALGLPLQPSLIVGVDVQQPPLPAVGHKAQRNAAPPQVF